MIKSAAALFIATSVFCLHTRAQSTPNQLSAEEQSGGWKLLYNGTSTAGWHTYNKKTAGSAWKSDGSLHLESSKKSSYQTAGGGDLITDAEYENFDLKMQWKISKGGNSGIIWPVKELPQYEETWNTGFEMQVLDNDGHPDGKILKHRAGDLYDLIKSSSEPVRPVGEWNEVEIKMDHGKLDFYMNGVHTISTTLWDANWTALIKGSKFKDMPGFTKYKSGHIALQDHGFDVWFRNIRIRPL
jgi:hypothetical protein